MVAFNFYTAFRENLAEGAHNFQTDQVAIAASNTTPNASHTQLSQVSEIAAGGGYSAGGVIIPGTTSGMDGGTYRLLAPDFPAAIVGGPTNTFRYLILYNQTHANDLLIGWWDLGSGIIVGAGEQLNFLFDPLGLIYW